MLLYYLISRSENVIATLQSLLQKERKKLQQFKAKFMEEIQQRAVLEQILRKCIQDIKEDALIVQTEKSVKRGQVQEKFNKDDRTALREKLVHDEAILNLIYEKIFHTFPRQTEYRSSVLSEEDEAFLKEAL